MSYTEYPVNAFQLMVQPLVGLAVSRPWKGYGSTIFLELGNLSPHYFKERRLGDEGEAHIEVSWDWRVENGTKILYGSSNSGPCIETGIAALMGATVEELSIVGCIPELVVQFSNGQCLRSMCMVSGEPEWCIKLPNGDYLRPRNGVLFTGKDPTGTSKQEKAEFLLADQTAARWGTPIAEPHGGRCMDCKWYRRLDGNGAFLSYGVCITADSPFDGRVVKDDGGCPTFKPLRVVAS